MVAKKHEERRDCQSDSSYEVSSPPVVGFGRSKRIKLNKEFGNKEDMVVAQKIDCLTQQNSQEEFAPSGRMDRLATPLKNGEQLNSAKGLRVTSMKAYFGSSRCRGNGIHRNEVQEIVNRANEEFKLQMRVEVEALVTEKAQAVFEAFWEQKMAKEVGKHQIMPAHFGEDEDVQMGTRLPIPAHSKEEEEVERNHSPLHYSENGSCPEHPEAFDDIAMDGEACEPGRTHHDTEAQENQIKVVDTHINEAVTISKEPGKFLASPRCLVDVVTPQISHQAKSKEEDNEKLEGGVESGKRKESVIQLTQQMLQDDGTLELPVVDPKTLTMSCQRLHATFKNKTMSDHVVFHMDRGIVGCQVEYDFHLSKKEVMEFLAMEKMDKSCMQLFIIYLHRLCGKLGQQSYGFLCPVRTEACNDPADRMRYIAETLKSNKKYYLEPIYHGPYWILCVICPDSNLVYWLDPMRRQLRSPVKNLVEYGISLNRHMTGKVRDGAPIKWISCKCRPLTDTKECGYFIMRFMYDIITLQMEQNMWQVEYHKTRHDSYTHEDINLTRDIWADFLLDFC